MLSSLTASFQGYWEVCTPSSGGQVDGRVASGGVQLTSVRWLSPAAQASTQESHALRGDPTRVPFLEHLLLPWSLGLSWTLVRIHT